MGNSSEQSQPRQEAKVPFPFTPGPWLASDWNGDEDVPIEIVADDRNGRPIDDDDVILPMICEVNTSCVSESQARGDARLIAAAPELLAALHDAIDEIHEFIVECIEDPNEFDYRLVRQLENVLAKAEGRAS